MIVRRHNGIACLAGCWPLDPQRPTLVFIHGSGQQGCFWQAQIEGLNDSANTIAVDLPGHGDSRGDGLYRVPDYAAALMQFIDAVNAPAPVVCGLSLGGAITLQLLIDYGERLKAGILVNTGARLKVLPAIIDTIENDYDRHLKDLIDYTVAPDNHSNETICRQVLASSTAGPTVTADDFRACDSFDAMNRVQRIGVPVLVLSAEHDILTPMKYANWLAGNIDGARHAHIKGAGHMSPIERPEAVNAAISDFLESINH